MVNNKKSYKCQLTSGQPNHISIVASFALHNTTATFHELQVLLYYMVTSSNTTLIELTIIARVVMTSGVSSSITLTPFCFFTLCICLMLKESVLAAMSC